MGTEVDLRGLAIDRHSHDGDAIRPRRSVLLRLLLPLVLLGGFGSALAWSVQDSLWPAQRVTVVPVVVSRAEVTAEEAPLFQAAGWVEPRPQPIVVSAFVEGIVNEILVVEGQSIEAGQVVARMDRRAPEIAVERADADVQLREAELAGAQASLIAA